MKDNFYTQIKGEEYNILPLDQQLSILKKYYPIGSIFHWKQPDSNNPSSRHRYVDYECIIENYVKPSIDKNNWLILRVRNINAQTINVRQGRIYENIHPGFFYPSSWFIRNSKLELIGI